LHESRLSGNAESAIRIKRDRYIWIINRGIKGPEEDKEDWR